MNIGPEKSIPALPSVGEKEQTSELPPIEAIAVELQKTIFEQLSKQGLLNLATTNKHLYAEVKGFAVSRLTEAFKSSVEKLSSSDMQRIEKTSIADLHLAEEIKNFNKVPGRILPKVEGFLEETPKTFEEIQNYIQALKKLTKDEKKVKSQLTTRNAFNFPPTLLKFWADRYPKIYEAAALRVFENNGKSLEGLSHAITNNKNVILKVVEKRGLDLRYVHKDLQKDPAIALAAVKQNGLAFQYVHPDLQKDPEIALAAVKENGLALEHIKDKDLEENREIALAAVQQNGYAIYCVHKDLQKDAEIALAAVKENGLALEHIKDKDLEENREIALAAVQQNGLALCFIHTKFEKDPEIILAAVKQNGEAINYIAEELKNDLEFMEKVREIEEKRVCK